MVGLFRHKEQHAKGMASRKNRERKTQIMNPMNGVYD